MHRLSRCLFHSGRTGRRTPTDEPIIARNFDYLPLVQPYYVVRDCRPRGKQRSYQFTTAPLAGAVDGLNEAGLCITYNYAFTNDVPESPAAPISMAIAEALGECRTVAEAATWIALRPRFGGGLLMLADADGDIASLELSSTRSQVRRPASGDDAIFHTNAFSDAKMREVQMPNESVYTAAAPTPLRGKRLHESSDVRDQRFKRLLTEADAIGADELAELMADHGPDNMPSANTPCVHSEYWNTTACLQFFPRSRRMRASYSSACRARYQDICLD